MKRFLIGCGLVLSLSTFASAALYNNASTTDVSNASGSWAWTTAWTTSIPASSVAANDAMLIHVTAYSTGTTGLVDIQFNGTSLVWLSVPAAGTVSADVRLVRTSATDGYVTGIVYHDSGNAYPLGDAEFGTFSWGSAQNLTVHVSNSVAGATHFRMGGVQR